ncbi:MAG TPA: alpha/beta hydrolase [Acidimicrobiales bacterium]
MLRSYGDSRLFGEAYGPNLPRVVWLHGWARGAQDFTLSANALAERGIGSVALDLPGFGASPVPDVAGGARHYAELIAPALREIASEPVVLVGHSFGGTVAVVVASEHPELVSSLVLVASPVVRKRGSARAPFEYRAVRWLAEHHLVNEVRLERARQKYGSTDYKRAQGIMRDVLVASVNESYEAELQRLEMPVTFVLGERDLDVPLAVATTASGLVPGPTTLHELSGIGHLVPLEAPGELVDAVAKALHQ